MSAEVSDRYQGDAGREYAEEKHRTSDFPGDRIDAEYFVPYAEPSHTVLDFGCGDGGIMRILDEHVDQIEGLEVNKHRARRAEEGGYTVYRKLERLPSEPTYDLVYTNHVLEHIRDVPGTLERIRSAMRPGGIAVHKLPLEDWRASDQRTWSTDDVDHHLQTWTPRLFANTFMEAGYEVADVQIVTSAWHHRLFPLIGTGLAPVAFWAVAVFMKARQILAVGRKPT